MARANPSSETIDSLRQRVAHLEALLRRIESQGQLYDAVEDGPIDELVQRARAGDADAVDAVCRAAIERGELARQRNEAWAELRTAKRARAGHERLGAVIVDAMRAAGWEVRLGPEEGTGSTPSCVDRGPRP